MSLFRKTIASAFLALFCIVAAHAEGFVLGVGAEADSADGRAISAFGDFGIGQKTWLSTTVSSYETDNAFGGMRTTLADVGIDHWFKPVGIRSYFPIFLTYGARLISAPTVGA